MDFNSNKEKAENKFFCLFVIILFQIYSFCIAQSSPSLYFIKTIDNKKLDNHTKTIKIDSLLNSYELKNRYDILFDDLYFYAVWYFNSGNYLKAISTSQRGLDVAGKLETPDPNRHAGFKNTIGTSHLYLGNYDQAFKMYNEIVETVKIDKRVTDAFSGMAWCSIDQGDYYSAMEYFDFAITKSKQLDDKTSHIINVINQSSNYYHIANKNLKTKGVTNLKNILRLSETDTSYTNALSPYYKTYILQNIGSIQQTISDSLFQEAENYFSEALTIATDLYKKAKDPSYKSLYKEQVGSMYNAIGFLKMKQNNSDALYYLNNALLNLENIKAKSIAYSNMAFYYANNSKFDIAVTNANQAIHLLAKFDKTKPYAFPSLSNLEESIYKRELLTALIDKAEILISKHKISNIKEDLETSLDILKRSDQLVDIIRLESDATESKLFWRNMTSRIYGNMVEICHKLNKANEAFSYIEKNKALLLLEDITQKKYFNSGNVPKDLITTYSNLKDDIRSQTELLNSQEKAKQDSTRAQLINSKTRLTYFLDSIQNTKYGRYFKNNKLTNILSLKDIQKSLEDNQSNISYILNEKSGYGLVITKTNHSLFKINNVDSLNRLTRRFQKFLLQPLNSKTEQDNFYSTSRRLYSLLLPTEIQSLIKDKSLLISADYYLQNLAFEALIDNSEKYLIENHIINYSYSSSFLETNAKIKREPTKDFIGFAPINFSNGLNRLKRTEQEIEAISNSFNGDNYYFDHADSKTFKNSINDYNIIHLATHANANDSIRPWIALHDKLITLDELYLTNNSAELVVLSACETGLGEIKQGEGVMSLARGFFNTGANSVVSSLWNVNDKSGTDIMTNFYKNLASGDSKSLALQKAKIDYINTSKLSQKSPYYWASFILIGDPSPIKNTSNSWLYILIALSIISLIFILFKRKHKILG